MNQTYVTLNDGNKIPQFGLGVYMIPGDENTKAACMEAFRAGQPVLIIQRKVSTPVHKGVHRLIVSISQSQRIYAHVGIIQIMELLIARGFKGKDGKTLDLDRKAGTNTIYALNAYKKSRKM